VALEDGLVVPVVKDADRKSLGNISSELKALVDRARTGKFTPDDLSGGTFSITNLGAFGIDVFDPVIVPPQSAILGVGRIAEKPVVVKGEVVVRSMMNLCLSFDHRILDGAPAARFLQRLKELLENPMLVLL
jgi:pyruvate dehydrogenase E2 component (dihydrolipoamide acetyltransferase)